MCGRYYIADENSAEELWQIIEAVNRKSIDTAKAVKTNGEIFPTDAVPVLANSKTMKTTTFAMEWSYTLPDGKKIINARSETAADKTMFKDGMLKRCCLIPASNYFEWEKRGRDKIKYAIQPTGSDSLFMAGIYRIEGGKPVFTILTREPAESIAFIHNRMPVILAPDIKADWLNPKYRASEILASAMLDIRYMAVA